MTPTVLRFDSLPCPPPRPVCIRCDAALYREVGDSPVLCIACRVLLTTKKERR